MKGRNSTSQLDDRTHYQDADSEKQLFQGKDPLHDSEWVTMKTNISETFPLSYNNHKVSNREVTER